MGFKKFAGNNLMEKVFWCFCVCIILPCILIFVMTLFGMDSVWVENENAYSKLSINSFVRNMENIVQQSGYFYAKTVQSQEIRKIILSDEAHEKKQNEIYNLVNSNPQYWGQEYYCHIYSDNEKYSLFEDTIDFTVQDCAEATKEDNTFIWCDNVSDSDGNLYIPLISNYINIGSHNNMGTVVVFIRETDIFNAYKNLVGTSNVISLVNDSGIVVSSSDRNAIGKGMYVSTAENSEKYMIDNGKDKVMCFTETIYSYNSNMPKNWKLSYTNPYNVYSYSMNHFRRVMVMVLFTVILLALGFSWLLSFRISKPYKMLTKNMASYTPGSSAKLLKVTDSYDEIAQLQTMFYSFIEQIDNLFEINAEIEAKKREAEYSVLQQQIKPHFIYNTLDDISWLIKMEEYDSAVKLVYAISQFFKISLHNGDKYILIEEEIEHLRSYIDIQDIRYPEKIQFNVSIAEDIIHYPTIKIILQPFVENCIKHAFLRKSEGCRVDISGYSDGDMIEFKISDNGDGFDTSILNDRYRKMLGIRNTVERIEYEYKNGSVKFDSTPGEGTTVTIRIEKRNLIQEGDTIEKEK